MNFKHLAAIAALVLTTSASPIAVASSKDGYVAPPLNAVKPCMYRLPTAGLMRVVNLNHLLHMSIHEGQDTYVLRLWMPLRYESDMPKITSKDPAVLEKIMQQISDAANACK